MEENSMNFNFSECVKSYDKVGKTVYVNICNNREQTIPWGVGGWFLACFLIFLILTLLGAIIIFIRDMFF